MRRCAHCKEFKPEEEFAYSNLILKTRQKHCRACMSYFHQKNYAGKSPEEKQQAYKKNKNRIQDARRYVWDYLSSHPCVDCGETDPRALEFDHIDPSDKTNAVSRLVSDGYGIERIQTEIDKCQVRCANCHRKRHYKDGGWFSR